MAAAIMVPRVHGLVKIMFCVAMLQSCAGSEREPAMTVLNAADLQLSSQNGILLKYGQPLTAIIFSLAANQHDTASIVCFNKGKEHGTWKKFYEDGRLAETRNYNNGKKTGDLVGWWPNGQKKLAYHFIDGEFNGVCREWTDKGVLVKEMTYKNGHEDGSQKQFFADGSIKSNYIIIQGRRYGLLGTKNCVNVSDSIFRNL